MRVFLVGLALSVSMLLPAFAQPEIDLAGPRILEDSLDNKPLGLSVVDIDLDGDLDVLATTTPDGTLHTYLADGHGSFTLRSQPIPALPRELVVGDFNEDGRRDVAVAHYDEDLTLLAGYGNSWCFFGGRFL